MLNNVSIIIPTLPKEPALETLLGDLKNIEAKIIVLAEGTRAKSLNKGAAKARQSFLWFLHADSRITAENLSALETAIQQKPNALNYFDLKFEGSGLTTLNAWGANIRSKVFGLPYGDQGFCISKDLFNKIGGYDETIPFGEDLIFIRQAKKNGVKLNYIRSRLGTSARKYHQYGWLKLTLYRQWQLIKLMRKKL